MNLKRTATAVVCAAGIIGATTSANAAVLINGWKINLGGIGVPGDDFSGAGVFGPPTGLDQLSFDALFHTATTLDAGPAGLSVGDRQTANVLGAVTQATGSSGFVTMTNTGLVLNTDFEITFESTTTTQVDTTTPIPPFGPGDVFATNSHLGPGTGPAGVTPNGFLNLYADIINTSALLGIADNVGATANTSPTTGGGGMDDSYLLATFQIVPQTSSGSFNTVALDGQDDATFVMTFNSGAIEDGLGFDLPIGATLAFADANTDVDPDNNGLFDTNPLGLATVVGVGSCVVPGDPTNNCGTENGSVVLANQTVPEPGTLALLGLSVVGLAAIRRRYSQFN